MTETGTALPVGVTIVEVAEHQKIAARLALTACWAGE
jgi:hypothetical protein